MKKKLFCSRKRRGFTLIEILVVVIIIATLAAAIALSLSSKPDEARVARVHSDISTLETAIENFKLDMRRYPTQEEGLSVLDKKPDGDDAARWKGPYTKRVEQDPWDHDYIYVIPGTKNENGFDLSSLGADNREGGKGYDTDIGNWKAEPEASN